MTTDADIQALACTFRLIGNKAAERIKSISESPFGVDGTDWLRIKALLESYQTAFFNFKSVASSAKVTPDYFGLGQLPEWRKNDDPSAYVALLDKITINCETALGYLGAITSPISADDKDRLNSLRQQIEPLERFNENLFKHVTTTIEEYEKGHYLASALLAGKIVVYVLEQLLGETDEDKANELVKSNLLDEKIKPNFLKGARRARGYFTHDIAAIPLPQDALSLVSDACDLSLKLKKTRQP